ncbi:hypothetical protein EVAR_16686_1 [Eumeta japonica]|uniref:Uncharacterized protein n=1 Tax=Eumeta variegata TaxID=151549 RepID=A0A4C1V568_EUMVA|nr:hypothetical protein EVAR_16686_1 [Eumeta japonica]
MQKIMDPSSDVAYTSPLQLTKPLIYVAHSGSSVDFLISDSTSQRNPQHDYSCHTLSHSESSRATAFRDSAHLGWAGGARGGRGARRSSRLRPRMIELLRAAITAGGRTARAHRLQPIFFGFI